MADPFPEQKRVLSIMLGEMETSAILRYSFTAITAATDWDSRQLPATR
jgi:hypothetical protein